MAIRYRLFRWPTLALGLLAGGLLLSELPAQQPPPPPPPPLGEGGGREAGAPQQRQQGGPRRFRPGGQKGGEGRNREGMMRLRQHLNELAQLPPDQLQQKLEKWPPYQNMDERQRNKLMERIEKLRARRGKEAMNFARRAGLVIPPDQQAAYVNRFWELRLSQEKQLQQKIETLKKKSHKELKAQLMEEYGDYLSPEAANAPKKDGA